MTPVSGIPFWHIVFYFVVYLTIHIFLGLAKEDIKKKLDKDPNNEELYKNFSNLSFAFKWFPAVYTLFVIIMLLI